MQERALYRVGPSLDCTSVKQSGEVMGAGLSPCQAPQRIPGRVKAAGGSPPLMITEGSVGF